MFNVKATITTNQTDRSKSFDFMNRAVCFFAAGGDNPVINQAENHHCVSVRCSTAFVGKALTTIDVHAAIHAGIAARRCKQMQAPVNLSGEASWATIESISISIDGGSGGDAHWSEPLDFPEGRILAT